MYNLCVTLQCISSILQVNAHFLAILQYISPILQVNVQSFFIVQYNPPIVPVIVKSFVIVQYAPPIVLAIVKPRTILTRTCSSNVNLYASVCNYGIPYRLWRPYALASDSRAKSIFLTLAPSESGILSVSPTQDKNSSTPNG